MRAAVFHKPKDVRVDEEPEPRIEQPRDAIVRVTSTAICGADLLIYNGLVPLMRRMTLGHEFIGAVEALGADLRDLEVGDRVVVPFAIADGSCWFCARGLPTHCEKSNPNYGPEGGPLRQKGGGLFGYSDLYGGYEGGQAQYVRVPYADVGPRKVPPGLSDEKALFLGDIAPAGWAAVDWPKVQPGESVAVFGCGPVGLMALKMARLLGAEPLIAVDLLSYRLAFAEDVAGARTVNAARHDPVKAIRDLTGGRGADVCVDAVGMEAQRRLREKLAAGLRGRRSAMKVLAQCVSAARRGGRVSVIGTYGGDSDDFPLGQLFDKGLSLFGGQAPVHRYIDPLMRLVTAGRLRLDDIITHVMPLSEAPRAYELFNGKKDGCVKVVLKP